MNSYNAIGRVGKDAQTRFTPAGAAVTGWSLAVDSGFGDKKQTLWLDCSAWGERFTKVAERITKGGQLGVTGELGTREHDGKTYLTLRVADISLIGGRQDPGDRPKRESQQRREPAQSQPFADDDLPPF